MALLQTLAFAGLLAAGSATLALAQSCPCSDWDGFQRTCVPCPDSGSSTGSGLTDEEREANRLRREEAWQRRQQERLIRRDERINRILGDAQGALDAGRRERAISYLWDAYRLNRDDRVVKRHLIRLILDDALDRGQQALLRGDASIIRQLERRYDDLGLLFDGNADAVADSGDLILQTTELQSVIADLREAQGQRRGLSPPPPVSLGAPPAEPGPLLLTWRWANGTGPQEFYFGPQTELTRALLASPHGQRIRDLLYSKYGGRLRSGYSYTNYSATFGLRGLFTSLTLSEQFVGRFRIDAEVMGSLIRYTATNTTSFTSYLYGVGPNWERETFRPMSNMRQIYVWWEPVQRGRRR